MTELPDTVPEAQTWQDTIDEINTDRADITATVRCSLAKMAALHQLISEAVEELTDNGDAAIADASPGWQNWLTGPELDVFLHHMDMTKHSINALVAVHRPHSGPVAWPPLEPGDRRHNQFAVSVTLKQAPKGAVLVGDPATGTAFTTLSEAHAHRDRLRCDDQVAAAELYISTVDATAWRAL